MEEASERPEWCSGTGWWYRFRAGRPPLPLRWVISRDPTGQRETRFYFATNQTLSGLDIVLAFLARWPAEATFEESRAHLQRYTEVLIPYQAVFLCVKSKSLSSPQTRDKLLRVAAEEALERYAHS